MNKNQTKTSSNNLVVTCATGTEVLLMNEIQQLGAENCVKQSGAVACNGALEVAYSICLWSRIASRVLWQVATAEVASVEEMYEFAAQLSWHEWFSGDKKFRVNVELVQNDVINSQHAAFKFKDAVRDSFQRQTGERPIAVKDDAQVFVNLFWHNHEIQISLDLAGKPLHQRGYRQEQGKAPLKENLAAALLYWSEWHKTDYPALIDPFCGSGTLLIEAAMMKKRLAPGLLRHEFALQHYQFYKAQCWQQLRQSAQQQQEAESLPLIRGFDADANAVKATQQNIKAAGLQDSIHVERAELAHLQLPKSLREVTEGLLITNAPYGERVGHSDNVQYLYTALGRILRPLLPTWKLAIFSNQVEAIDRVGLAEGGNYRVSNGPIRCYFRVAYWADKHYPPLQHPLNVTDYEAPDEQKAFVNRLRKNLKPLRKWAEREGVSCYRIYDADMPEFNMAIDWYDGELHVQEYKPPKTVAEDKAQQRLDWAMTALVKLLDIPRSAIVLKTRAKQKGKQQYRKLDQQKQYREICESGAWLLINLRDYLDTGVFLDHRPVRQWIHQQAKGKRFLNLFSYTGAATVHAALGGAKSTVSVDMSRTYLDWARSNLMLNGLAEDCHRLIQANCLQWLEQSHEQFDLIFMDPPTFSNSKRMKGVLDLQRDHPQMIAAAMKRLEPGGKLLFSNNFKRFIMDPAVIDEYQVKDLTRESIPFDFQNSKGIHCCFEIQRPVK